MKTLFIAALMAITLSGCTVVPVGTAHKACRIIEIARQEADLAPAWYLEAGDVLQACGEPDAKEKAKESACAASKRNGYDC